MPWKKPAARLAALAAMLAAMLAGAHAADGDPERVYQVEYRLQPDPGAQMVDVRLTLRQDRRLLREMRFDAHRVEALRGDGEIIIKSGQVTWMPPPEGGQLAWRADVPNMRDDDGYDAWLNFGWGLFRAEDVIPRAGTLTLKGAVSETRMRMVTPPGWTAISQYPTRDGRHLVRAPGRRFAQPSGWLLMGELGVRRERIAGTRVVIAAPEGEGVRRLDMLALLNWTLPELDRILPETLERLTVVSAGEPMWRGALSAPSSLYIHADRPLISENGTSTLLHEVMHVALGLPAEPGFDWISEGLAEFYSLELLKRSGTLSEARHRRALEHLEEWSDEASRLCRRSSSGPTTALAVTRLVELDRQIREASGAEASLDDVLQSLVRQGRPLDLEGLRAAARQAAGKAPAALADAQLPGCN